MPIFKIALKVIAIVILGALGSFIFNLFLFPYMLVNPYFERLQFVKDFKQGRIIVNSTEKVYIQENFAIENAIQRVKNSIVAIQSAKLGLKSGLIVTSDGLVVSLADSLPQNGNFNVFVAGESVNFEVVKTDLKNNLALIKIDKSNLSTIAFADFDKVKLGQRVFLVASVSARQDNWLANEGIIRGIDKNSIKTNISDEQAAAGSPLFNSAGELVGLSLVDLKGKVSAVPIDKIQTLLGIMKNE